MNEIKKIHHLISRSTIAVLAFMLWVQWPLRVFFDTDARSINDMGQIAFAFLVVTAFAQANLHQTHLRINLEFSDKKQQTSFEWIKYLFITPWAVFIIYSAWPIFINSLLANERFPDSYTVGFYLIKFALLILPLGFLFSMVQLLMKAVRDKF